jgi:hypothetical protein
MAGFATLKQAIVSLGIEEAFFIETCFLEAVVYIRGKDKIILSLYKRP